MQGTWQFLAVQVLRDRYARVIVAHEMESFLYVILWYAIRYLPHNCTDVGKFMYRLFDDAEKHGKHFYCGLVKAATVTSGKSPPADLY